MKKIKAILICILIGILGNYFLLSILPKFLASTFVIENTITNKYIVGIIIRIIGLLLTIIVINKLNIKLKYNIKITKKELLLSWMFFVYIFFNIEIININNISTINIILMIIDSLIVGFYEEFLFRGLILNICLKEFKNNKIIIPILVSSIIFGMIHFMNLASNDFSVVLYQVLYATIIGISFSSLLIRTNFNIVWCSIIHGLYDVSSGLPDLVPKTNTATSISLEAIILGLITFIPLLIYAFFLIRKSKQNNIIN